MFKNFYRTKNGKTVSNGYLWVTKEGVIFSLCILNFYNYYVFFILDKITHNLKEENSVFPLEAQLAHGKTNLHILKPVAYFSIQIFQLI